MAFWLLRLRADGTTHNEQTAGSAVYRAKVGQIQNFAKDKFSETQEGKIEVSFEWRRCCVVCWAVLLCGSVSA